MQAKAVMVVGGEPGTNEWVRDGLAGASHTFVLPLAPADLPPTELRDAQGDTPPRAVRRLLYPSLVTAVRQSAANATVRGQSMVDAAARVWSTLRQGLRQTVWSRLGHRPIVSVPEGLGLAEWLADECDARIVCLSSHPLALAAHHKRLTPHQEPARWIERACREWVVSNEWIAGYRERRRDFVFVSTDEIIGEPFVGFHRLYRQLGLPWSGQSQSTIAAMMSDLPGDGGVRPDTWRRTLTHDEVARVRRRAEGCRRGSGAPRSGPAG